MPTSGGPGVGQERERADLTLPVARRAASVKDRRDIVGVGHRFAVVDSGRNGRLFSNGNRLVLADTRRDGDRPRLARGLALDRAAHDRGHLRRDPPAGQHRIDRVGQIVMTGWSRRVPRPYWSSIAPR